MSRPADSVLRWCRHRGMKMYEPLFRVCVTVPGTFSLNRTNRRPLSGRYGTLWLPREMVSVEQEPSKRNRSAFKEDQMCRWCLPYAEIKYPSARNTGDPTATLTDSGRRPKLLTHHSGWRPNLSEVPESKPE